MKMLHYPFVEQFDVPTFSVEFCDCQGFVSPKVCKEAVYLAGSEVFICDHSESLRIAPGRLDSCKLDDLIADYTLVQKIDGSHLDTEIVQSLDIVHRSICKVDIDRKIPPEVKERMHLDTRLGRPELSPRTELQTETYGAAVKGIYHIVYIEPARVFLGTA